ncbi:MAG: Na/Pi cotransporter family protein [Bacteroidales bacterium]|nr:Na/Pi cotransporter family protein [Bacteroidales bacterium]
MEQAATTPLAWGFLLAGLFGGLVFFLYGMWRMSEGLKHSAGSGMRKVVALLTNNRFTGLLTGALVTAVIQSSSATTVMLISFVRAGLITLKQSLGVILGADIGTTFTAQLIAFELTDYALILVIAGFFLMFYGKRNTLKHIGEAIFGFGILFYGMKLMSDSMDPLRSYPPFLSILHSLENPFLGLLAGTLFTALMQSSSAFIGIIIVLSQQGALSLEAWVPLILGANIGTCVTAALASFSSGREAKRVALGHVLFKMAGVLLLVFWIPAFSDLVVSISPVSDLYGTEKVAAETPRQIANAHSLFNIGIALVFLPFTGLFNRLILKILPGREGAVISGTGLTGIDKKSAGTPSLALALTRAEIAGMIKMVEEMFAKAIQPLLEEKSPMAMSSGSVIIREIEWMEKKIDQAQENLTRFLLDVNKHTLTGRQSAEIFTLLSTVKSVENISDVIKKNMLPVIARKQQIDLDFSHEGKEDLKAYHIKVSKQLMRLRSVFEEKSFEKARKILYKQFKYLEMEEDFGMKHLKRLTEMQEKSIATHELHTDILEALKLVHQYTVQIARGMINMSSAEQ